MRGGEMLVEQRVEGEALEALAEDVRAGGESVTVMVWSWA